MVSLHVDQEVVLSIRVYIIKGVCYKGARDDRFPFANLLDQRFPSFSKKFTWRSPTT